MNPVEDRATSPVKTEKIYGVSQIALENRTECRLLSSVAEAYGMSISAQVVNFDDVFGRQGTSETDLELAKRYMQYSNRLSVELHKIINHEKISDGKWRKPNTLNDFVPYLTRYDETQNMIGMTLLLALQPEIDLSPGAKPIIIFDTNSEQDHEPKDVKQTILQARLLSEIIIEVVKEEGLDIHDTTTLYGAPDQTSALYKKYLDKRTQMKKSIKPYMDTFRRNLTNEFFEAIVGSPDGHALHPEHPEWKYEGSINSALIAAQNKQAEYEHDHVNFPWQSATKLSPVSTGFRSY